MIENFLSGAMAALALAGLLLTVGRLRPPRRRRPPTAGFRVGPLWTWCPDEQRQTPHLVDVGGRRCLSCKTSATTTSKERAHG
ncbi:hypothetical protein ACFY0G_17310 [Streptomyces sp. NPDC001552]|uniref:hypothetical protein n=1 Tax=Streptomyces sp. NPDC001552 TaxID=3364587 RepID=UPI0036B02B51